MLMSKKERQNVISKIISSNQVDNQEKLINLLQEKGVVITQATLSRDIKEMQIVKVPTIDGNYAYQLPKHPFSPIIDDDKLTSFGFISINFSGNLAVIKTRPGYAMGIAGEIDKKITKEILGTVAGDDTILLIIRENITHQQLLEALSIFGDIFS